ncbi:MAG: VCBS repeat-containing protein [Bacteroidetes bacterium]|nr:VCBS repeat-containing protein [Bacteroidota bacterium]
MKGISSFSIADINKDKLPDIFIGQLWSEYPATGPDLLPSFFLLNNGFNDFTDNTTALQNRQSRRSRGSEWVDFDNDGDLDLFITNYLLEHDELWQNDGNGKFTNVIDAKGIEQIVTTSPVYYNHGTGCDWADYDNDGDMDLLLTQFMHPALAANGFEGTTIYKNAGAPNYTFQTSWNKNTYSDGSGIGYEETHSGGNFGDVNNDGLPDIILPVYYGCRYADFYVQNQNHTFSNATFDWGLEGITSGEDASFADFDNDGRLDLAFANNGLFRLFRNQMPTQNNSVTISLLSSSGNRNGIGSRVTVFAGGKKYMQEVTAGRGQRMQKPTTLHFGIEEASKIDSVQVRWSSKITQETFINVGKNSVVLLEEGKGSTSSAVEKLTSNIPEHSWLAAPNPNPIDQSATIRLGITTQGILEVDVIRPNGAIIANLSSLKNTIAGEYLLTWDCSTLESGVYFIRMLTTDGVYVQKAIITR